MGLSSWLKEKFSIKDGAYVHMSKLARQEEQQSGYDYSERKRDELFDAFIESVEDDARKLLGLNKPDGAESSITFKERVEIREMFDDLAAKSSLSEIKMYDESLKDILAEIDKSKMSRDEKKQFEALKKEFESLGKELSSFSMKDLQGEDKDTNLKKLEKYSGMIDKVVNGYGKFVSDEAEKELAKKMEDRQAAHNKMVEKETRELAGEVVKRMDGSRHNGREIEGEAEMAKYLEGKGIREKLKNAGLIMKDVDGHEGHGAGERERSNSRGR